MVRDPEISEAYICCICGATLKECRHWGPICRRTNNRVCAECCRLCEYHRSWSGIWKCCYITQEQRNAEARKRAQERFDAESMKISLAYREKKREQARQRAIRSARARAGKKSI